MRTAVIYGSTVANVIEADTGFDVPGALLVASDEARPGWSYDPAGGTFSPPAPPPDPVPEEISDRQFFQQLALDGEITHDEAIEAVTVGQLPDKLSSALASIPDATRRFSAAITLMGATIFKRSHPLTEMLGQILNKDSAALDDLWRKASKLP